MTTPRLLSFDLGNGFVKHVSSSGDGHFPSVYAMEEPGIDFDGLKANDDFVIGFEDQRYAIGWSAWRLGNIPVRTLDSTRITGDEYRLLFAAALAQSCAQGAIVEIVLSLPLSWYDRRDEVKEYLSGEWSVTVSGRQLSFSVPKKLMKIIPEGFGTVCFMALDRNGRQTNSELLGIKAGVVDVGTKTTDCTMFDGLQIVPAKTEGIEIGLSQVYNIIYRNALKHYGRKLTFEEMDDALNGQHIFCGPDDITDAINEWSYEALKQISNAISGSIKTLWGGGKEVQRIYLTGGGGVKTFEYLANAFKHLYPVSNGPMANAIGGYEYGLLKRRLAA